MNNSKSPFTQNEFNKEIFIKEVSSSKPEKLISTLLAISLVFSPERVGKAIYQTWDRENADLITTCLNASMRLSQDLKGYPAFSKRRNELRKTWNSSPTPTDWLEYLYQAEISAS